MRVQLERPTVRRAEDFIASVRRSRDLHRNRVSPPDNQEKYQAFLRRIRRANHESFLVALKSSRDLAGVVVISEIIRGQFQSAFLGYYALQPHAGKGLMREGLHLAVSHSFRKLRLHRLEANIQPDNERSIALVRRLGFEYEGTSRRYLKVSGRWRDHERWAILSEDWPRRS